MDEESASSITAVAGCAVGLASPVPGDRVAFDEDTSFASESSEEEAAPDAGHSAAAFAQPVPPSPFATAAELATAFCRPAARPVDDTPDGMWRTGEVDWNADVPPPPAHLRLMARRIYEFYRVHVPGELHVFPHLTSARRQRLGFLLYSIYVKNGIPADEPPPTEPLGPFFPTRLLSCRRR